MRLLIDWGNSRIKWARASGGRLSGASQAASLAELGAAWRALQPPDEVLVSSVVGSADNAALTSLCRELWGLAPYFARTQADAHGVRIAYAEPEKLGVDRWLAMIAARRISSGPSLVVDCGTAVTLDALDADGVHQGGLIAPGLHMMWDALFSQTHIPPEPPSGFSGELGKDTPECASAGALSAVCGLIERTHARLADRWGAQFRLILTGGDAARLTQQLSCPLDIRPLLVLDGLVALRD